MRITLRVALAVAAVLIAVSCSSDASPPRPDKPTASAKSATVTVEDAVFVMNPDETATLSAKVVNGAEDSYELSYGPSVSVPGDQNSETIVRFFNARTAFAPGQSTMLGDEREGTQIRLVPAPKVGTTVALDLGVWVSGETVLKDEVTFKLDVPVVERTVDHISVLGSKPNTQITIEDGKIVVIPGQSRALVDGSVISSITDHAYELPTANDEQGNLVEYRHNTSTGGPYGFSAEKGKTVRISSPPYTIPDGEFAGDFDYFDAKDVTVGEKITVNIPFQSGDVLGIFTVVRG